MDDRWRQVPNSEIATASIDFIVSQTHKLHSIAQATTVQLFIVQISAHHHAKPFLPTPPVLSQAYEVSVGTLWFFAPSRALLIPIGLEWIFPFFATRRGCWPAAGVPVQVGAENLQIPCSTPLSAIRQKVWVHLQFIRWIPRECAERFIFHRRSGRKS